MRRSRLEDRHPEILLTTIDKSSNSKIGVGSEMKQLVKIAGLCLASMLVMGMAITATASAAPHWLVCSTGGTATKYTTSQCTTASSGGTFQWNEVTGTESAVFRGSLLLKDTSPMVNDAIECLYEWIGSVGPGKYGRINEIIVTPSQCRGIKNCENVLKIGARDLPWQTELYESEKGVILQTLAGTGSGEPGWEVECKVGSNKVNDVCIQEAGKPESVLLENKVTGTELLVLATLQSLRKTNCSAGGKEKGELGGALAGLGVGKGLRVSS